RHERTFRGTALPTTVPNVMGVCGKAPVLVQNSWPRAEPAHGRGDGPSPGQVEVREKRKTMRVLVSSAGTRGDVQPVLALALEVRELGGEVRLCVPPNFLDWAGGFGFDVRPMGVVMRPSRSGTASSAPVTPLTAEQLRQTRERMPDLIADQFDTLGAAAQGCDVVLGANAHQYAARSIAELNDIPYVNALYAPIALPSPDHAPPPAAGQIWEPGRCADNEQRWNDNAKAWNDRALERINHNRIR